MNADALLPLPRVAKDAGLGNVEHLFNHIQFAQPVKLKDLLHAGQLVPVFGANFVHIFQPLIGKPQFAILQRRFDAAAAIMATDNDVTYLQNVDCILHDGQAVGVAGGYDIGNIAMDKKFSGKQPDNFIGRHAAVGTSNPQILRLLEMGKSLKKPGVPRRQLRNPPPIIIEELFQLFHGDDKLNMRFGPHGATYRKDSLTEGRGPDSVRR